MARRFLLPLLAFALFTTEAATAQTTATVAKTPARLARAQRRASRTLTARERRQAEATAKAAQKATQANAVLAMNTSAKSDDWNAAPPSSASTTAADPLTGRPMQNVSVAPGMPLNQIGHGVTTDYNGRPLQRTSVSTTMAAQR